MGKRSQCRVIDFSLLLLFGSGNIFSCIHTVLVSAMPGGYYPTLNIELNKSYTSVQFLASAIVFTDLRLLLPAFGGVSRSIRESQSLLHFHTERGILVNQEQERALLWEEPWIIMFASATAFPEHAAASWREAVCAAPIKDGDGASGAMALLRCVVP